MDKFSLTNIEMLLIEPDLNTRVSMRKMLNDAGFRKVKEGAGVQDILCEFQISMPDIIISDIHLLDGNFNSFVYKLRHHDVGYNPFLPILATAFSPTTDDIRAVVQAGADDLIVKPLPPGRLTQHIRALITSRKPFMVTSSYIGPDHRRKPEDKEQAGRQYIPSVDVPNTLRAKAIDAYEYDENKFQRDIRATIKKVNLQKLGSHANQTAALVDKIVPGLAFGPPDEATQKALNRLLYVAEDIARRMVATKFEHVAELCQSLIEVTRRIINDNEYPDHKDVNLLKPLSSAIQHGFEDNDAEAALMAHKISESVMFKK